MPDTPALSPPLHCFLAEAWAALDSPAAEGGRLTVTGEESLPSFFLVTDLATAVIGAASLAVSDLLGMFGRPPPVTVERHLASAWFITSLRPREWELPAPWEPIAGDYRSADGWIRLHTNAPHHRAAALAVLGCAGEREVVAAAVSRVSANQLEAAILRADGCAAAMRDVPGWQGHPQGEAVRAEPLVALTQAPAHSSSWWPGPASCGHTGARPHPHPGRACRDALPCRIGGRGAAIDPPGWEEPPLAPDVTPGKRCARLDLRRAEDKGTFEVLLAGADILVHGYRPGALEGLGYGTAARRALTPGLIDVSLSAYWRDGSLGRPPRLRQPDADVRRDRRRRDGLEGRGQTRVQALDHATGYLMAAATVRGLTARLRDAHAVTAVLSLARTAAALTDRAEGNSGPDFNGRQDEDYAPEIKRTAWGAALRLRSLVMIGDTPLRWDRPASKLGSAQAS